jgi:hypothetical protein
MLPASRCGAVVVVWRTAQPSAAYRPEAEGPPQTGPPSRAAHHGCGLSRDARRIKLERSVFGAFDDDQIVLKSDLPDLLTELQFPSIDADRGTSSVGHPTCSEDGEGSLAAWSVASAVPSRSILCGGPAHQLAP